MDLCESIQKQKSEDFAQRNGEAEAYYVITEEAFDLGAI